MKHDTLTYEIPSSPTPFGRFGEQLADTAARMSFGSPALLTWQRACEASLEASRRRRQSGSTDWFVKVLVYVLCAVVLAALVIGLAYLPI